jgi:hypothetical protein
MPSSSWEKIEKLFVKVQGETGDERLATLKELQAEVAVFQGLTQLKIDRNQSKQPKLETL